MPFVSIGELPTDRPLQATATRASDWGWTHIRIAISEERAVATRQLGKIDVDYARFTFADADVLTAWMHEGGMCDDLLAYLKKRRKL